MPAAPVSVVIPVFNMWELTQNCLESLAATTTQGDVEVIVVDNASTDATQDQCAPLGKTLFGDLFHYLPQEKNKNFGPACNIGARQATGDLLFFLNNDTILTDNWLPPLLNALKEDPALGGVGPLLLYPAIGILKERVQHLGIAVNHDMQVHHLYEGFPAEHPVVRKKRRLQAITGAALLLKKELFEEAGEFDEAFINCFEDVELCTRIKRKGYYFSCEPASVIYHLTSQTPGRHAHAAHNDDLYRKNILPNIFPDYHRLLREDGFEYALSPWLRAGPSLPQAHREVLDKRLSPQVRPEVVEELLNAMPLWKQGYSWLAHHQEQNGDIQGALAWSLVLAKLYSDPEHILLVVKLAHQCGDKKSVSWASSSLAAFVSQLEAYSFYAKKLQPWGKTQELACIALQAEAWLAQADTFREQHLLPLIRELKRRHLFECSLDVPAAYAAWVELYDTPLPPQKRLIQRDLASGTQWPGISLLMPINNTDIPALEETLSSIRGQSYPHWELCIADDASTNPEVAEMLRRHMAEDARIKVFFHPENGHISRCSNTALELASFPWTGLIDHNGRLPENALYHVARAILDNPQGMLFFSDEDKILSTGVRCEPYFKPAFDPDMFCCCNTINHFGVYNTQRLRCIGGFRPGFEGAQDYDIAARFIYGLPPEAVVHIPKILYHRRIHEGSTATGGDCRTPFESAMREHISGMGRHGKPEKNSAGLHYTVRWEADNPAQPVCLLIPCRHGNFPEKLLQHIAKENPCAECLLIPLGQPMHPPSHASGMPSSLRILPCVTDTRAAALIQTYSAALQDSHANIAGLLDGALAPLAPGWLTQAIAELEQPDKGTVGGLLRHNGHVYHAGYAPSHMGKPVHLFRGIVLEQIPKAYFGWMTLPRRVLGVSSHCMLFRKDLWQAAGEFDESMGAWFDIDFALRLEEMGKHSLFSPYLQFEFTAAPHCPDQTEDSPETLHMLKRWSTVIRQSPLRNPQLKVAGNLWSLF